MNIGKRSTYRDEGEDSKIMGDEELQIVESHDYPPLPTRQRETSSPCVHVSIATSTSTSPPHKQLSRLERPVRDTSFTSEDFDVCKEYGYRYEYSDNYDEDDDDDDDLQNSFSDSGGGDSDGDDEQVQLQQSVLSKLMSSSNGNGDEGENPNRIHYQTFLLGRTYHPINDHHLKRSDESNLFWMTYRCDFAEIKPYNITSDSGWGCMLRSAQMLLAQTLRMHYKGRDWMAPKSTVKRREDEFMRDLMAWFADYPYSGKDFKSVPGGSDACSWYSLHNMVGCGFAKYDVLPGEWFGPGISCHVLRDLVELHFQSIKESKREETYDRVEQREVEEDGDNGFGNEGKCPKELRVYVATGGTVYKSDIKKLMNKCDADGSKDNSSCATATTAPTPIRSNVKESSNKRKKSKAKEMDHPLSDIPSTSSKDTQTNMEKWDASLLLLIPLRLGLKHFNAETYKVPLAHMLSLSQSVGFLGGSPRHALWFYGANSDGRRVFGLDPHTVQRAPRRRVFSTKELTYSSCHSKRYEILLTDEYLRSINCPQTSAMNMSRIDPSLALGFYCRDLEEFESLSSSLKSSETLQSHSDLFTIVDRKPDYAADVSSAMMDLIMSGSSQMSNGAAVDDDDDDYILL
uniref:Cysteine protease n=1 Tax=Chaetoceros debilis TaxID=122233 RepID=A0A7S3Q936_9STRA